MQNPNTQTPTPNASLAVIVLAAGKGTRMKSELPKVLHPMAGMPMLGHVLHAARSLNPQKTVVITGYGADQVEAYCQQNFPEATFARQEHQLGTGHAVMQAEAALASFTGTVIIMYGDVPLLTATTLHDILHTHTQCHSAVTIGTAIAPDPTGLGRIIRNAQNQFQAIVEHKDATEAQRTITEINTGIYAASAPALFRLLKKVTNANSQAEYYLTDVPALAIAEGSPVAIHTCTQNVSDLTGVNSPEQLAAAETAYQARKSAA